MGSPVVSLTANGLLGDATIIGNSVLGAGILTSGQIGTLAGAAVYQWNSLPTNSQSLAGFGCGADAIAVASALPMSEIPGFEVANAVDADTGLDTEMSAGDPLDEGSSTMALGDDYTCSACANCGSATRAARRCTSIWVWRS